MRIPLCLALILFSLGLVACEKKSDNLTMEDVNESLQDFGDKSQDRAKDLGDATQDSYENYKDAIQK